MSIPINTELDLSSHFDEALQAFFSNNTPDSTYLLLFKIFQCWGINNCKAKAEIPDKDVALFLDQLNSLVAAAYILHQGNRVLQTEKGMEHE